MLSARLLALRNEVKRDFVSALASSYGMMGLTALIQIALVPFYLQYLGREQFGLFAMLLAGMNYAAVGITWLAGGMARVLAERAAVGHDDEFREAYAFSKAAYAGYACMVALACWAGALLFGGYILKDESGVLAAALFTLYFILTYDYNTDRAALTAKHLQYVGNLREAAGQVVFAGCAVASLRQGWGLPGVVLSQLAGLLVTRTLVWLYWRRNPLGLGWDAPGGGWRAMWNRLTGRMGQEYVVYGILLLTLQADVLIIGLIAGPAAAATYYLVWRIPEAIIIVMSAIPGSYSPFLIASDARGEYGQMARNYRWGLRAMVLLAGVLALSYATLGNELVALWVGPAGGAPEGRLPYLVAALSMFYIAVARWPAGVAYALTRTRPLVKVAAAELAGKLVLVLLLYRSFGFMSALAASVIVHTAGVFYLYLRLGATATDRTTRAAT